MLRSTDGMVNKWWVVGGKGRKEDGGVGRFDDGEVHHRFHAWLSSGSDTNCRKTACQNPQNLQSQGSPASSQKQKPLPADFSPI